MNWLTIVTVSIQVTLVAAVGLLTALLLRSAAHRHSVLLAAMLCILASPIFYALAAWTGISVTLPVAFPTTRVSTNAIPLPAPVTPSQQHDLPQEPFAAAVAAPEFPHAALESPPVATTKEIIQPAAAQIQQQSADATPFRLRVDLLVSATWLMGTILCLTGVLRSHWKTQVILKTVRPLDRAIQAGVVVEAARQLGVGSFPRIGTTGKVAGPVVIGIFRPWVLIPARYLETLSRGELLQVLIHEGAHALRRDPLQALLQRITGALFWWNPLIHLVNQELTRAREEVCDNFVLTHVEPETYGATLLRLATLSPAMATVPLAIGMFDGRGKLEERIRGLLDSKRKIMTRIRPVTAASVLGAFTLFSVFIAAARVGAQSPADAAADAPAVATQETIATKTAKDDVKPPLANEPKQATDKSMPLKASQWGEAKGGLRARLSGEKQVFDAGEPIPLKLEIENASDGVKEYEVPHNPPSQSLKVVDERGRDAPQLLNSDLNPYQAAGPIRTEKLESGQSFSLTSFNLTSGYYLRRPGRYTAQWTGKPASAAFEFEVVANPAGAAVDGDPLGRLLPLVKEGWLIGTSPGPKLKLKRQPGSNWGETTGQAVRFVKNPPVHKGDGLINLFLADEPAAAKPVDILSSIPISEYLGKVDRWHIYFLASEKALAAWPSAKEDIKKALAAEPAMSFKIDSDRDTFAQEHALPHQPGATDLPKPQEIEGAKQLFRNSREDSAARAKAARVLYPLIKPGTPRLEVLNLLGAPDRFLKRESYSRFLNYVIGEGQRIEIEFDRNQEKVVRKQETGLGIDPRQPATLPIPENLKQYLADYLVDAKNESDRTVLRSGFVPDKPQIVWGEPLVLTMTVANVGDSDFEFMFGGDYRGAGRHNRIKITMTDANGNEVPDPHANAPELGGILWHEIITPGGLTFTQTIDLTTFRTITDPGQYTLTCSFAFGEPHTNNQGPAKPVIKSSFPFTILARSPERVTAILEELQARVATAQDNQLPEAIAAIARFGLDDAVPRLDEYTKTGTTARRKAAFAALQLVPGEAVLGIALAGLSDADPAIRIAAYSALGLMPQTRSIDALLNALAREQSPVREAVLVALGTSKSSRALPVLSRALDEGSSELQFAAVSALIQFGGPDAVTALHQHVNSPDWAFRYKVVNALVSDLRSPLNPDWLVPILMCRRHNSREWLDSLTLVRIWSEDKALPVLLSCIDYDVPWSHRNSWILHHAKYAKGAPEFDYIYDPNNQGTPEQHEKNRQTLRMLRTLSGPIPKPTVWPSQPVPLLETNPQIDFTTTLSSEKGEGETMVTVRCGFLLKSQNRNGGSVSFEPSEEFHATYQVAENVRAILTSSEQGQKSGLTERQLQELRKLEIPPKIPVIKEGLNLLYIWWHESPDGPIRQRARDFLCESVRAAVQKHHTDHVTFATAARMIMGPVQKSAAN